MCKLRNHKQIKLTVIEGKARKELLAVSGMSLLEMLKGTGYYLPAQCNGKGTCGKCKVKVDQEYRLACATYPQFDCIVEIPFHGEGNAAILTEAVLTDEAYESTGKVGAKPDEKGIIVDIGTTTIAMQLVGLVTGEVEKTFTTVNKQRAFGADVISRIDASVAGEKDALRKSIQNDLLAGLKDLVIGEATNISKMIIAANTTMVHLLMGYDCNTLGVSPFTPVNIDTIRTTIKELLGSDICDAEVIICPGISTYVGGDIVAGLFALGFEQKEGVSVLIDLGTNGEMAIGNKDRILVTSTAAGPAFEGGNITCGVASVPGAICGVEINEDEVVSRTIGDAKANGICGTGVIEAVAELRKSELLDKTGLFKDEYFETGYRLALGYKDADISVYQKDIREIQLAKAAVRAGVETLISKYGTSYDEIEDIYIAGGFGYEMNIDKAIAIGLLPEQLRDKIKAVGNACLSGAYKYLLKENCEQDIKGIIDNASEVQLSNEKEFNDLYVGYMYFE